MLSLELEKYDLGLVKVLGPPYPNQCLHFAELPFLRRRGHILSSMYRIAFLLVTLRG